MVFRDPRDDPFLVGVEVLREKIEDADQYPYNIPALRRLDRLPLHPHVTFFVGENGSGKSTLLEAIAVAAGFNAEGGSKNFHFSTRASHSSLHAVLKLDRGRNLRRPKDGFFFRAESYFTVATAMEREYDGLTYGDRLLHEQSHGESFFALVEHRLRRDSLLMFDEPEAALSPTRQLEFLQHIHRLVKAGCQFVVATHSPILLGYPHSRIYAFLPDGLLEVAYEDTEHYRVTREFLLERQRMLQDRGIE